MNKHIKTIKVKDLETSTTDYTYTNTKTKIKGNYTWNDLSKGFLDQIPEEYYNREIDIIKNEVSEEAYSHVFKIMNERYVFKQLELNLQATDLREIFYMVRQTMDGELKLINVQDPAKGITGIVKRYCEKLCKHLGYKYWGYIYDYLKIKPKETVIIYDTEMNTTTLSSKNLKDYVKTPFFLIICEKEEPLRATMEEMKNRGYNEGFYGVVLGGMSTSYNIKLLIELSEIRIFYAFIMMDLDFAGIVIFLDMLQWFPCESIGITPEMLDFSGMDFEAGCENYKPKNINFEKMFKKNNISIKQRKKCRIWRDMCTEKRFEINSLTALRLKENINESKARDFCNYLISKIEETNRAWNINRYDKPIYTTPIMYNIDVYKPKIIEDIEKEIDDKINYVTDKLKELINKITEKQEEIKEKAHKKVNDYLDTKDLKYNADWEKLIEDKVEKMHESNGIILNLLSMRSKSVYKKVLRKNRKYKGEKVVKETENIITNQTKQLKKLTDKQTTTLLETVKKQDKICKKIIRATSEYKEIKRMFIANEKEFTETNFKDFITNLQEELNEMFKELIKTIDYEN